METRGDALEWAMALAKAPAERVALRQRPLPDGMEHLLQVAAGASNGTLVDLAVRTGESPEDIVEAARFYAREILFHQGADAYRVLGVAHDADAETIRTHHRLLQQWLHPDRHTSDWDAIFAARVNAAWSRLRSEGRRQTYDQANPPAQREHLPTALASPTWLHPQVDAAPADTDRWRRRAPVLGLIAVCGVLAVLAVRDMQREPEAMLAGFDEVANAETDPASKPTDTPVALHIPVAAARPTPKPIAVAVSAKPAPKPVAVAVTAKPLPKPIAVAVPAKPLPMPIAAVVPVKAEPKRVALVAPAKPAPKPGAVAVPAKPLAKPIAVAVAAKPEPKPVAVVAPAKSAPKPVTVAASAKPLPKPIAVVAPTKPAPKPVAITPPAKPAAKPIAVATATPAKPAPKPVAIAAQAKPEPKPVAVAVPATTKPAPKPLVAAVVPAPPAQAPSAAISETRVPTTAAAIVSAPRGAPAASAQHLQQVQKVGGQLMTYMSKSGSSIPPIWGSLNTQRGATQLRDDMLVDGNVKLDSPYWRVGDERASMKANIRYRDGRVGRLSADMAWRDQRWLVTGLSVERDL